MSKPRIPAPPKGTGVNGAKLWRDVLGQYELEEHELALLREMVRTVDLLDRLAAISAREGLMVQGPHGSRAHRPSLRAGSRRSRWRGSRLRCGCRLVMRTTTLRGGGRSAVLVCAAFTRFPDYASARC
jgi:hypothetical protein